VLALGQWVLKKACDQLLAWAASPATAQIEIAVNVSARQFHHPQFVAQALELVAATGVDARRLKLELTETSVLESVDDTIAKMNALKTHGVTFALDDFGTGLSGLPVRPGLAGQCSGHGRLQAMSRGWRVRQHDRIAQSDNLPHIVGVDHLHTRQSGRPLVDIDLTRVSDKVVEPLHQHLHQIVFWIVGNAQQRHPLGFDLVADFQRCDLDLGLLSHH
jgi:hypothetical protein